MKTKFIFVNSLGLLGYCLAATLSVAEEADDFFDISPVELATIPITIANVSPGPVIRSPALSSLIKVKPVNSRSASLLQESLTTGPQNNTHLPNVTGNYTNPLRYMHNAVDPYHISLFNGPP